MLPVLSVPLRDSNVNGYKQAHHVRIREGFARKGVVTAWYLNDATHFGRIVLVFDQLEGGRRLWKSFLRTADLRGLKVYLVDKAAGDRRPVRPPAPESTVWSLEDEKRPLVLVST